MKHVLKMMLALSALAGMLAAQSSPPAQASTTIAGKSLLMKYSAPSVRGRRIYGAGGLLSRDPTYPIWRAGANSATAFHTDADVTIGTLNVPKGDYTFYVLVKDPDAWELIVSKATGQWGLDYPEGKDLGRVKMTMSKPASPVEKLTYTFSAQGAAATKLDLAWENHVGSVVITAK